MKIAHSITFSVFVKNKEFGFDPDFLAEMFKDDLVDLVISSDFLTKEDMSITIDSVDPLPGFPEKIYIPIVIVSKKSDKFIQFLLSKLEKKDRNFIADTLETRIDDECVLYLRFDKKSFVEKKELVLVDNGDCIHCKIKVAAYPANKDSALAVIRGVLA